MLRVLIPLICAFAVTCLAANVADAKRVALVIGNSGYTHASALPNPANDARDLAAAFGRLGYEVELVEDASRADLLDALRGFRTRSLGAEHSVIYYAGHGVEIDRENFVVPVDAELKADIDVEYEAVPLSLLVAATSGAKGLQLVVLDACRDNPFLTRMTRTLGTRSAGRGLARYEPEGNSLVAYSAREGTVALDGTGTNSPYAQAFLRALDRPGLEIGQFFRQVRDSVVQETNGQQEPFLYGSLSAEPIFFQPVQLGLQPVASGARTGQATPVQNDTLLAIDLTYWQSIKDSTEPTDFEDYLNRFPSGQFRALAQRRLAALSPTREAARSTSTTTLTPLPSPLPAPQGEETPNAAAPAPAPEPTPADSVPLNLSRSDLRDLQARLNILGYDAGVEDGLSGPRTRAAIVTYKEARQMGENSQIDTALLRRIGTEVPETRLIAYRNEKKPAATPAPKKETGTTTAAKPKPKTAAKAKPKPKAKAKPQQASGNFRAYVGRTYCRSNNGKVLNGRNLSDRPIFCMTILAANNQRIQYRISRRLDRSKPISTSNFTKSRTGARTFGSVTLSASGAGSLKANGNTFVASQIYR